MLTVMRDSVRKRLLKMSKDQNIGLLKNVNVQVCHFFHGSSKGRSHGQRQYMLMTQFPWKDRLLVEDEKGLLAWKDTEHYFYNVAKNLHTVNNDLQVANKLFRGHLCYEGFYSAMHSRLERGSHTFKSKEELQKFVAKLVSRYKWTPAMNNVPPEMIKNSMFMYG